YECGQAKSARKEEMEEKKKVRISLDVTPGFYERLEALEELVEGDSKAGVIRQALQLYEFLVKQHLEGASFRVVRDGAEKEIAFFGFPEAAGEAGSLEASAVPQRDAPSVL